MKLMSFFLSLGVLFLSFFVPPADAEFICSAEVSYKWARRPEPDSPSGTPGASAPAGGQQGGGSTPELSNVRYAQIERSGPDELGAKRHLEIEANRVKVRASDACRREHEGFGSCVSTKFATKAALLNSLDFHARKELQKALTEECKAQLGSCIEVSATEPQCREIVVAQPSPAPGSEKKEGKKK